MFLCGGVVLDVIFNEHLGSFFTWALSVAKYLIAFAEQETPIIEKGIYVIGLMVTVFVVIISTGGLLMGIMKAKD